MTKNYLISISLHILFWIAIVLTYVVSAWGYRNSFYEGLLYEGVFLPVRLVAVYVNWFILIPHILYRNKTGLYLLIIFALILLLAILQRSFTIYWAYPMFFPEWVEQAVQTSIYIRLAQYVLVIMPPVAYSTGFKLFSDWYKQKNKAMKLEKEKVDAELKYLKAQINPHFLFNTLNNIYGLAREKSDKVPNLILKLAEILSFNLYEANARKIALKQELTLIKNMIDLEMDRFDKRIDLNLSIEEPDTEIEISPMLLLPLVENAFKHGVRNELGTAQINIKSEIKETLFSFYISNTITESSHDASGKSGIGLSNLKRRLNLLYPEKHSLTLKREANKYIAILTIEL